MKTIKKLCVATLSVLAAATMASAVTAMNINASATVDFSSVNLSMMKGASVRMYSTDTTTENRNGIRFAATFDAATYARLAEYDAVEYGMVIAPENYCCVAGKELTKNNLFGEKAIYSGTQEDGKIEIFYFSGLTPSYNEESSLYEYYGAVVNMLDANIARNYVGRGYVKVTAGDETDYLMADYADDDIVNNTRSILNVAIEYYADESVVDQAAKNWVKTNYIDKATASTVTFANSDAEQVATHVGSAIVLPESEKDGFEFKGWTDGTNTYAAGEYYVVKEASVTLTAVWEELVTELTTWDKKVTLTYDTTKFGEKVIKYENAVNTSIDRNQGVLFPCITDNSIFTDGNKYVTFDFYVEKGEAMRAEIVYVVDGAWNKSFASGAGANSSVALGATVSTSNAWLYGADGNIVTTVQTGAWYTLTIMLPSGASASRSELYSYFCISGSEGGVTYIKNIQYTMTNNHFLGLYSYDGTTMLTYDTTMASGNETVVKCVTSSAEVYNNGIGFNCIQDGSILSSGYKYISFDFYVEKGNKARAEIIYNLWDGAGEGARLNKSGANFGEEMNIQNAWLYDGDGNEVKVMQTGKWYTVVLKVPNNASSGYNEDMAFFAVGGSEGAVWYVKNVAYTMTNNHFLGLYSYDGTTTLTYDTTMGNGNETVVKCVTSLDEAYERGVGFNCIKDGSILSSGYKYISFDFYVEKGNYVRGEIIYNLWDGAGEGARLNKSGANFGEEMNIQNAWLYDEDGNEVKVMQAGKWYTVVLKVPNNASSQYTNNMAYFAVCGPEGAVWYVKNVAYTVNNPKAE